MEISLFFGTCCMGIWGRADVDSGVRPAPARYEEASPRFWGIIDRGLKPDGTVLCSLLSLFTTSRFVFCLLQFFRVL